jgi:hypothetical protein
VIVPLLRVGIGYDFHCSLAIFFFTDQTIDADISSVSPAVEWCSRRGLHAKIAKVEELELRRRPPVLHASTEETIA